MSDKIDRAEFLQILEEVRPGLSHTEITDQSSCYVFSKGHVYSFNGEIFCKAKTGLPKDFKGAVPSARLYDLIKLLPDEKLTIDVADQKLVIVGKGKRTRLAMDTEVRLPVQNVETPEEWQPLHEDFGDAVGIVGSCASKDKSMQVFTCLHVTPFYLEACDNTQMARYKLPTGVSKPFLVKKDSINHVPKYDFVEFAESPKWLHFRTNKGTVMSLVRYVAQAGGFQDLSPILRQKGRPTKFPKALGQATVRCELFSSENAGDENMVKVEIKKSLLRISGVGASGDHEERKKLKYDGPAMTFSIAPKLLVELVKRFNDCEISRKHVLRVNGGKFKYCVCLEPK